MQQETLPREDLEALQLRRLRNLCARVYATVPFYAKRFAEVGVTPDDIKTLDDVRRLPFTEKQDLRNHYPFGLFAVPKDHIVRLHASSGTTGKAVVVGYTARDLENWAGLMARSMAAAGVNSTDVVHVAYGYGLFTGGLGRALPEGPNAWGPRWCPHRAGPPGGRPPCCATLAARCSAPRLPMGCTCGKRRGKRAWIFASCPCASASSGLNPGPKPCAGISKPRWISTP